MVVTKGGKYFVVNNEGGHPVDGSRMKVRDKTTKRSHNENSNHTCIRYVIKLRIFNFFVNVFLIE